MVIRYCWRIETLAAMESSGKDVISEFFTTLGEARRDLGGGNSPLAIRCIEELSKAIHSEITDDSIVVYNALLHWAITELAQPLSVL